MRTNFYVDGFNLYYRAIRGTRYKWLDISKLCQSLTPAHQINHIRYFTALIRPRPDNPGSLRRQLTFIRALETIPNLDIHYGQFRERRIRRPLVTPIPGIGRTVEVFHDEEKGTDGFVQKVILVQIVGGLYKKFNLGLLA